MKVSGPKYYMSEYASARLCIFISPFHCLTNFPHEALKKNTDCYRLDRLRTDSSSDLIFVSGDMSIYVRNLHLSHN